jgi:hypothetical protein
MAGATTRLTGYKDFELVNKGKSVNTVFALPYLTVSFMLGIQIVMGSITRHNDIRRKCSFRSSRTLVVRFIAAIFKLRVI